jgi:hypothetical protein
MRHPTSIALNALAVASAAALLVVVFLWATSYHRFRVLSHDGRVLVLGVSKGSLTELWFRERPPTDRDWDMLLPPGGGSRFAGLEFAPPRTVPRYTINYQNHGGSMVTAHIVNFRCWQLAIPYWMPAVAAAVLPAARLWAVRRRGARKAQGKCVGCGYDLRGSPARCPECGAVPAAATRAQPV